MMGRISIRSVILGVVYAAAFLLPAPQAWSANTVYLQTNLVSDIPGLAQAKDPNLKNPWGVSFSATSPFWSANAGSNTSSLYSGTGSTVSSTVVGVPGGPTGTVRNGVATDFIVNGRPSSFTFATLAGSIYSYTGTVAEQSATVAGASFTGLALANNGSGNYLYAANDSGAGSIEVFNSSFAHVTLAGSFKDPNLPSSVAFGSSYVPYNIQNINGQLYVEYANFKTGGGAMFSWSAFPGPDDEQLQESPDNRERREPVDGPHSLHRVDEQVRPGGILRVVMNRHRIGQAFNELSYHRGQVAGLADEVHLIVGVVPAADGITVLHDRQVDARHSR